MSDTLTEGRVQLALTLGRLSGPVGSSPPQRHDRDEVMAVARSEGARTAKALRLKLAASRGRRAPRRVMGEPRRSGA
jgi:hypothetical protein